MAERANVLLLDEPTNHLAFDILEEFEKALIDFPGPILAVSHDRWFIQRFVAGGAIVWELDEGRFQPALDPERLWQQVVSVVPASGR
jgi:macrolide transport system ATP-binding/permease protein